MEDQLLRSLIDDIVMEVLCRLSAYDITKFRRVCKRWAALLYSQYFAQSHIKVKACSSPMILINRFENGEITDLLHLVDNWETQGKRPTIREISSPYRIPKARYELSYDGLIIVRKASSRASSTDFIIFNPLMKDTLRIIRRSPEFGIWGMFFNPLIQEYCILWGSVEGGPNVQVNLLNLGGQPYFRNLKLPSSFLYKPRCSFLEPPVVIDSVTIYWLAERSYSHQISCEELILAFDIGKEEFAMMPHPDPRKDCQIWNHKNMQILKMNDCLSFCAFTIGTTSCIINIWTLKDPLTRLWIKSYSVCIGNMNAKISTGIRGLSGLNFRVSSAGDGKLFIGHLNGSIYICDLQLGTVSDLGRDPGSAACTFMPSLISLRNCKPEIFE